MCIEILQYTKFHCTYEGINNKKFQSNKHLSKCTEVLYNTKIQWTCIGINIQKFRKKQFTYKGIDMKLLYMQRNQYDHYRGQTGYRLIWSNNRCTIYMSPLKDINSLTPNFIPQKNVTRGNHPISDQSGVQLFPPTSLGWLNIHNGMDEQALKSDYGTQFSFTTVIYIGAES